MAPRAGGPAVLDTWSPPGDAAADQADDEPGAGPAGCRTPGIATGEAPGHDQYGGADRPVDYPVDGLVEHEMWRLRSCSPFSPLGGWL